MKSNALIVTPLKKRLLYVSKVTLIYYDCRGDDPLRPSSVHPRERHRYGNLGGRRDPPTVAVKVKFLMLPFFEA